MNTMNLNPAKSASTHAQTACYEAVSPKALALFRLRKFQPAFTLIELMIVIAIIAILATIAIPSYQNYTKKAALSEVLQAASAYKTDVEICFYNSGNLSGCDAGSNGIQAAKAEDNSTKYVKSVSVKAGVISVEGKAAVDGYGYTLTPVADSNNKLLSWKAPSCKGGDLSLFPANFCSATASGSSE